MSYPLRTPLQSLQNKIYYQGGNQNNSIMFKSQTKDNYKKAFGPLFMYRKRFHLTNILQRIGQTKPYILNVQQMFRKRLSLDYIQEGILVLTSIVNVTVFICKTYLY